MEVVQGQVIQGQSVEIDHKTFIDCTLINCILNYSGEPVTFQRTRFQGCRYVFFGLARRTVHFLQGAGLMDYDPADWGELPSQVN
jgi:hypothetical protein